MISIEDVMQELKNLTPEQLQQAVEVVHGFSANGRQQRTDESQGGISQLIVDQAVLHGWPQQLFTELMGSLPDPQRAPQSSYSVRQSL